jgi:hypothetical protein
MGMSTAHTATPAKSEPKHFGRNGFRLEVFESGGFALHQFDGDQRGEYGRLASLVGFKLNDFDLERTIKTHAEGGALVRDERQKHSFDVRRNGQHVTTIEAASEECAITLARFQPENHGRWKEYSAALTTAAQGE